jgi:hypothetical protein
MKTNNKEQVITNSKEQVAKSKGRNIVPTVRTYYYLNFAIYSLLFALCSSPLWAQSSDNDNGGYYVTEQRYVQTIEWVGGNNTLKYEVVIEKEEDGEYKAFLREFTEKPNLQVSLPLGKYRYRVIPYDYLEHPGEASDWVSLEIEPAPADTEGTASPVNLYISASWTPLIPLYGRMSEIFENKFYPAGVSVRFGILYNKLKWLNPGMELSASWYDLNNDQSGDTIGVKTGVTGINIVAQIPLPKKMAVTLKAGAAILYQISEINIEDYSYWTGGLIPQINAEASFLWFVYKQLYLEAGIGFYHLFNKDGNSGILRPWLGAGWQF